MPGLRSYYIDVACDTHCLRGHRYRLKQRYCKYSTRQHFFLDRSVPLWNSLPDSVVAADMVNVFKARLDKFWTNQSFLYDHKAAPEAEVKQCHLIIVFK